MADESTPRIHLCIDRPVPFRLAEEAQRIAATENPANAPDPASPIAGRIALDRRKLWTPGRQLRVRFLDGDDFVQGKVRQFAVEWTRHANIGLLFGNDPDAEIRISFTSDPGRSWSAVGTDCLLESYFPRHQPTMCFGWFDADTPDEEFSRVTLHEFGHALGCIHEHQNPAGGVEWNEDAVLAEYAGSPNFWDAETIRFNILDKYSADVIRGTEFDPDSIMLYAFPARLTRNGIATHENNRLSDRDIEFIQSVYPADVATTTDEPSETESDPWIFDPSRAAAPGTPTFHAVLIGADFYQPNSLPGGATYLSLGGCVADAKRMAAMLGQRVKAPCHVDMLIAPNDGTGKPSGPANKWPTAANIRAAFDGLASRVQPGDQVFIHYSGHGGRVKTIHPAIKGANGIDETLVPIDIGGAGASTGSNPLNYIRDVEIVGFLKKLADKSGDTPEKRVHVSMVFDSCHAGGTTRGLPEVGVKVRAATDQNGNPVAEEARIDVTPVDDTGMDTAAKAAMEAAWRDANAAGTRAADGGASWLAGADDYVLLAACRDTELANEVQLDGGGRGGVLTDALLDALRTLAGEPSWNTVHELVVARVQSKFSQQTPLVLGERARSVFGVALSPVPPSFTVSDVEIGRRRVRIAAGLASAMVKGTDLGIYQPGTTDFSLVGRLLGTARVVDITANTAWAELAAGVDIGTIPPGAQAVVQGLPVQRRVFLRSAANDDAARRQAFHAVAQAIADTGRGFLVETAAGETPHYQVAIEEGNYSVWDPQGKEYPYFAPALPIGQAGSASEVVERLRRLGKFHTVLELSTGTTALEPKVSIELQRAPAGWQEGDPLPATGTPLEKVGDGYVVAENSYLFFKVVNGSSRAINLVFLDLQCDWGITQFLPMAGQGRSINIGRNEQQLLGFRTVIPQGYGDQTFDVLKAFVTVGDGDLVLDWLQQPAIGQPPAASTRSVLARGPGNVLERLGDAFDAQQNPSRAAVGLSSGSGDWLVQSFRVLVKKNP